MKKRGKKLLREILLSFLAVVLISVITMAVTIGLGIRNTYGRFVRQNDRFAARQLADAFNEANTGFKEFFSSMKNRYMMLHSAPRSRMRDMMAPGGRHDPREPFKRIVVLGSDGQVLFDSHPELPKPKVRLSEGFQLSSSDGSRGVLFAGTMIDPRFGENDRRFIRSINAAILLSLTTGLFFAVFLAWLLAGRITRPLTTVSNAAGSLAAGNPDIRVRITRNDEIGQLAGSFNAMAEQLQKNTRLRKELVADTAHELRTPVSLIRNRLELMLEGVYEIDREGLEHVYRDSIQLAALIEDLQKLYSAESERTLYDFQTADIRDLLKQAVKSFDARARQKQVTVRLGCADGLARPLIDPARMLQVFHNLLINALEWTPENSTIHVSCRQDCGSVIVDIEDEGPGIPEEHRSRIFDRLYRVDPSRNRSGGGGSGLGLAICRQIIDRHRGTIKALQGDKGALFRIELPLAHSE